MVQLRAEDNSLVAEYIYSGYGEILSIKDASGNEITDVNHIANVNPIRYRGYYYDTETGFYYLRSRYYDPITSRFISQDSQLNGGLLGNNMFAYCENNPVNMVDSDGDFCVSALIGVAILAVGASILSGCSSNAEQKNEETIPTIKYDVPLYKQGNLSLCWAFCQTMIESYDSGTILTQKEAKARAIEIARSYHGSTKKRIWNQGGWPSDLGDQVSVKDIETLYDTLKNNGPVYAYYSNNKTAHLVVVTGVDLNSNVVYTNNPWGVRGVQSFEDFQHGFATKWYNFSSGKAESEVVIFLRQ